MLGAKMASKKIRRGNDGRPQKFFAGDLGITEIDFLDFRNIYAC